MKKILGIETSCDETAAAIVGEDGQIFADCVLSQTEHLEYGGVVPEIAARAHLDSLDLLIEKSLSDSNLSLKDIDAIAVTAGPGLIGGVLVGVVTAKALAVVNDKPIIAVNHLEGHALAARITEDVKFPYLLLLASGGHSQLLIVEGVGKYKLLGSTLDDALGECFDKCAKLLGLGYPGGPAVEKMAANCKDIKKAIEKYKLPQPMVGKDGCDFSFSGLKTAVKRIIDLLPETVEKETATDICASFQYNVGEVIRDRVSHAINIYKNLYPENESPTIVVSGGVAANKYIRSIIEKESNKNNIEFKAPPIKLCTDNGVMIAWAGMEKFLLGHSDSIDFPTYPRWPLDNREK